MTEIVEEERRPSGQVESATPDRKSFKAVGRVETLLRRRSQTKSGHGTASPAGSVSIQASAIPRN
jgi:hypothetical protein